jgi:hypothetical protein
MEVAHRCGPSGSIKLFYQAAAGKAAPKPDRLLAMAEIEAMRLIAPWMSQEEAWGEAAKLFLVEPEWDYEAEEEPEGD